MAITSGPVRTSAPTVVTVPDAPRKALVIVGAGGHGREALDIVEALNEESPTWDVLGFLDDGLTDDGLLRRRNTRLLGPVKELKAIDAAYVIGIGSGAARARIAELAGSAGRPAATIVHPAATIGGDVELGDGVVIAAGARVTTHVRLGRHVHLNTNTTVAHDCVLDDFVTVLPGANVSGAVHLGEAVTMGAGSVVIQERSIGAGTFVGAGAVVVDDLPADVTAVGVPARAIGPAQR